MVIDDSPSTFLKDIRMLDSVLVANEVVEEIKRHRRCGLCLKVDYEKMYDSVKWNCFYMICYKGWTFIVNGLSGLEVA